MALTNCPLNISKSNKQGLIISNFRSNFKNKQCNIGINIACHNNQQKNEIKLDTKKQNDKKLKNLEINENSILNQLEENSNVIEELEFEEHDKNHRTGYIALIGLPNVGKSTLLNSLVGQKLSIVTEKPQTTRNKIMGLVSEKNYQMIFMDTPGVLTRSRTELDKRMMISIKQAMTTADIIFCMLDLSDNPKADLEMIQLPRNWQGPCVGVILNKCDLISKDSQEYYLNWFKEKCRCDAVFMTCAKTGKGIKELKEWTVGKLPYGPSLYPKDIISEHPERFFVTEIIREKIFLYFREEIPYSTQVNILQFQENPGKRDLILVEVITERPNQRAILLGNKGKALQLWRSAATADIERFLGRPINLQIYIKVIKNWRKNSDFLQNIRI